MVAEVCLVQLKAFGDLVIATAAVERVVAAERSKLSMIVGAHLRPLCAALQPDIKVVELSTAEMGVPSLFDVKRNGPLAALQSARHLRAALSTAPVDRSVPLVFDRVSWRERFIVARRPALGLPKEARNIYEAWDRLLRGRGFQVTDPAEGVAKEVRRVGIFPGSRIAAKNLPAELVREVVKSLAPEGVQTDLFLLDGERPDLEASDLPQVLVPRDFSKLRDAVASVDLVVSADSLPAHFAETLQKRVFVFTPSPNDYWLPLSALKKNRWTLFDDPARLRMLHQALA